MTPRKLIARVKLSTSNYFLLLILFLAIFLRLLGAYPGYPTLHPDEPAIAESARRIVLDFDFRPVDYYYGAFLPVVYAVCDLVFFFPALFLSLFVSDFSIYRQEGIVGFFHYFVQHVSTPTDVLDIQHQYFTYWARYETAVLSGLAVIAVYFVGKRLFNKEVGLISAFLTAINYRHVLSSTFALADAPASFFALISVLLSLRLLTDRSLRGYIIAGIGLALALSVKYFIYVIPVFLLCHIFSVWEPKVRTGRRIIEIFFNKKLVAAAICCVGIFSIINFYLFIDYHEASKQFLYNAKRYRLDDPFFRLKLFLSGQTTWQSLVPLQYLFKFGIGEILSIFVFFGFIIGISRNFKSVVILSSVIFPFLITFVILSGNAAFMRNYASIMPFLLLFPSIAIVFLCKIIRNRQIHVVTIVVLTLIIGFQSLRNSYLSSYYFSQDHNIVSLYYWLEKNIKDTHTQVVAISREVRFPEAKKAIIFDIDPDNGTYFSLDELQKNNIQWVIIGSSFTKLANDNFWTGNKKLIPLFFDMNTGLDVLSNTYVSLAVAQLGDYRVKEFIKPFWYSLEPAFFVVKVPYFEKPKQSQPIIFYNFEQEEGQKFVYMNSLLPCNFFRISLSGREGHNNSRGVKIEGAKHNLNQLECSIITQVTTKKIPISSQKWYELRGFVRNNHNASRPHIGNGFFRLDFYSSNNGLLKTYVSKLLFPLDTWTELAVSGISPVGAEYATATYQFSNQFAEEEHFLDDLRLFQSDPPNIDYSKYPFYNKKLPKNFIWLPQM